MAFYHFTPSVQSFADLHPDELNGTIRAGDPLYALRILQYSPPADPPTPHFFYHLGPSGFHDANAIVRGVMIDGHCAQSLFPPDLPPAPDESLTDEVWETLTQCLTSEEFGVVFGILNGGDVDHYADLLGGRAEYDALKERLANCGFHIRGAKFAAQLEKTMRAKQTPLMVAPDYTMPVPSTSPTSTVHPLLTKDPNAPDTAKALTRAALVELLAPHISQVAEGEAMGEVKPLPPEVFALLQVAQAKRKTPTTSTGRIRWPFKNMKVGDHVAFRGDLAKRAGNAAHVYASRRKWAFSVLKDGNGGIIIVRQPDPSPL